MQALSGMHCIDGVLFFILGKASFPMCVLPEETSVKHCPLSNIHGGDHNYSDTFHILGSNFHCWSQKDCMKLLSRL